MDEAAMRDQRRVSTVQKFVTQPPEDVTISSTRGVRIAPDQRPSGMRFCTSLNGFQTLLVTA
jgi:hypothetical protein